MDVARLSRPSDDGVDPFESLCRTGLRLKRGLDELVWELLTLGLGVPSYLIRACYGSGDRERLGSSLRPSDHPKHHALLRATVAGLDPLELAFWGQPSVAIGWGAGSAPSLERGPRWVHYSAAPDLTLGSWLVLGVHHPVARQLGVRLLRLRSWRSP
jgi:hypothetical protein